MGWGSCVGFGVGGVVRVIVLLFCLFDLIFWFVVGGSCLVKCIGMWYVLVCE